MGKEFIRAVAIRVINPSLLIVKTQSRENFINKLYVFCLNRVWVYYVSYGWRRDNQIVLSSHMISWEYITVIAALEETGVVSWKIIVSSPRQCTSTQYSEHPTVRCRKEHHYTGTTSSLFTISFYLWLFLLFPKLKAIIKRNRFKGVEAVKRTVTTELGHPRRILPAVHRSVTEKSALDSSGVTLKGKKCRLLFGIKINCLWQKFCYF